MSQRLVRRPATHQLDVGSPLLGRLYAGRGIRHLDEIDCSLQRLLSPGTRLGLALNQQELDAGIAKICDQMKAEGGQKCRVAFYYLLAEHFGKLDHLAS